MGPRLCQRQSAAAKPQWCNCWSNTLHGAELGDGVAPVCMLARCVTFGALLVELP
ncbi:hypothetical protein FOA52_014988 [Chlamydomonas sp. UWO 241]|nr:hypothetical protein FOA52_014988 [Chlamydomonas sp. UWO 241]